MSRRLTALNHLPAGRQLPRTPPSQSCVRTLRFTETHDDHVPDRRETFSTPPIRLDTSSAPESMTKGMKDYQMTSEDLQFMQTLKEEKELKRLQDEVVSLENEVRSEAMALELTLATRAKSFDELFQFPSCEEIRKWALLFLEKWHPSSTELSVLDVRALLALVSKTTLTNAISAQTQKVRLLNEEVTRKQKDTKKRVEQANLLAAEKSKILGLMAELAELKSSLAQQREVNESLEKLQDLDAKLEEKPAKSTEGAKDKIPSAKTETHENSTNPGQTRRRNPLRNAEKTEQAGSAEGRKRAALKNNSGPSNKAVTQGKDPQGKNPRKLKADPPTTSEASTAPRKGQRARPATTAEATPAAPVRNRATAPTPTEDQGLRRSKRIASRK